MALYKTTLSYSIQNGGDGSAYPRFMESMELCEFDQEYMYEGWGESCTGEITITSGSPINHDQAVVSVEEYLLELWEDVVKYEGESTKFSKFFQQFYINKIRPVPVFRAKVHKEYDNFINFKIYNKDTDILIGELNKSKPCDIEDIEKELNEFDWYQYNKEIS